MKTIILSKYLYSKIPKMSQFNMVIIFPLLGISKNSDMHIDTLPKSLYNVLNKRKKEVE